MAWSNHDLNVLRRTIPQDKYLNRYSSSRYASVQLNALWENEDIIIAYWSLYNVFVVWNAVLHKKLFTETTHTLSVGADCHRFVEKCQSHLEEKEKLENKILSFKKRVPMGLSETIFIVGKNALQHFCEHYQEYDFSATENEISEDDYTERELISANHKKRDPTFRHRVLEKYNNTCIVCGSKEPTLLQAAHIKSVAEGGSDDTCNGYCLCANHHVMFDAGLLEINMKTKTFTCNHTSETDAVWYREAEKRAFKLFLPHNKS